MAPKEDKDIEKIPRKEVSKMSPNVKLTQNRASTEEVLFDRCYYQTERTFRENFQDLKKEVERE